MSTYYIHGSKASTKDAIRNGVPVYGENFSLFGGERLPWEKIPNGSVIKFYTKMIGGSPYAKSYGQKKDGKLV